MDALKDKTISRPPVLEITVDHNDTFSLAAQQNAYPVFKRIQLHYPATFNEEGEETSAAGKIADITVSLTFDSEILVPEEWSIDCIEPKQTITLQTRSLKASKAALLQITDPEITHATIVAKCGESVIATWAGKIDVLPPNYWGGEARQPDLLAAFVRPNGVYVEDLIHQVTKILESNGHGRSVDGYQSGTRDRPYLMLAALWNVIASQDLSYVSPPIGFATQGQRIRLAQDISNQKNAACLDTSLLFASCIEGMGLNAVVALGREHAFAGAWLIDQRLPVLTNDDPMDLRKRVDAKDLILFETTLVTNAAPVTFREACTVGRDLISEEHEDHFVYVIDIRQARARQIRALSTSEVRDDERKGDSNVRLALPDIPPLPPVRSDERREDDTPQTRIDMWQRRLLDLTKRNALLNHSDRAVAIKLFCPNIAEMEDLLAEGKSFKFQSATESPVNDRDRDQGVFRLSTGNDLHKQHALDQLQHGVLMSNQSPSELEKNAINLLRKAKNDLEEGGANTLFLSLGYLRWKETPEADRSYRAPLILIPVELQRKSARAAVYLKQNQEEQPLFNLTLIEFLATEHGINLNQFKDELPTDESGIDVQSIWATVRDAVSEQEGFEVLEELSLGSFSFAKYLMWKDLHDRLDDLKENQFVAHLVDRPREAYQQNGSFVLQDRVDKDIDPRSVFTPLNCDSSQLVAVEASGKDQDFVLEGPPGTGKSETIANIIAHNIAIGRKVLFVAEKMAALNVVYRRLEKIGLDHLCLELHSNKANKRAVLDQLRSASTRREDQSGQTWIQDVNSLMSLRDSLNAYVEALHHKSAYGPSVRDCIARSALYSDKHVVHLDWPANPSDAPIKNGDELETLLGITKKLALAYNDIRNLDTTVFQSITATSWSHAWQKSVVSKLNEFAQDCQRLILASDQLTNRVGIKIDARDANSMKRLEAVTQLTDIAMTRPMRYALAKGAKESLSNLHQLAENKKVFDDEISAIAHGATYRNVIEAPIQSWQSKFKDSGGKFITGWFTRRAINKEASRLGFSRFTDFSILERIASAQTIAEKIESTKDHFEADGVWTGWGVTSDELKEAHALGLQAHNALTEALALTEDPLQIFAFSQKHFVDGRDFLDASPLRFESKEFADALESFSRTQSDLAQLSVQFDPSQDIGSNATAASSIVDNEVKLKLWCEWKAAIAASKPFKLDTVIKGLEAQQLDPFDAEAQVMTAFCRWLSSPLMDASDLLREFKSSSHEDLIKMFRALDEKVAKTTSQYIRSKAARDTPDIGSSNCPPEFGVLARELQKKTKHKPIRALLADLGTSVLDLCPCLMMSPMSVAQFLPVNFKGFDLVVFDEASQMTTWDSVGAIARGRHVIVVGDPKQMPPTNFFNASVDTDDPDEEDLESILDQALAARLHHLRLKGHYRSRHETLIAFSNSKYYENSLVSYPSAETKESAVTLKRVNGVYAKGKGRNNPIEAREVVQEVVRRLRNPTTSKFSIGIVTLNTEQQRTIDDLLDDARRTHPEIEPHFQTLDDNDPVFVKNLESVQGDERDVIILSLGYGPTEPMAKTMGMNFGPLNRSGGERRLNVAITRAKHEVLVFSSFDSSMIDLSRTSAVAVEHLKHYLEFAEKGPIALAEQATADHGVDQFDSDFEQAVAFALRERGWSVQTQVGVTKFRIDLGIKHPDKPGVYLAGVECDGATYHGSPSARDRDRVRHIILENLGWRLVRLWSTDYFVDPNGAIEKIHTRLTEILEEDRLRDQQEQEIELHIDPLKGSNEGNEADAQDMEEEGAEHEGIDQPVDTTLLDAKNYFDEDHKAVLTQLAKSILAKRNGIKLHTLALEIANQHGLSRTSKKQIAVVKEILTPWSGTKEFAGGEEVVWLAPDDISDVIAWRGVDAFGYERDWSEIPYPEAIGLAQHALKQHPSDPVDFICRTFDLKRRREKTIAIFQSWIHLAQSKSSQ